jgi:hypothetical protein
MPLTGAVAGVQTATPLQFLTVREARYAFPKHCATRNVDVRRFFKAAGLCDYAHSRSSSSCTRAVNPWWQR